MSKQEIWVVSRECGGYHGSGDFKFIDVESSILGFDRSHCDGYYEKRKTYFTNREDAEYYVYEISKKIYDYQISDRIANSKNEDGEDEREYLLEEVSQYEGRGFHMIRQEELKEGDPLYELYGSEEDSTTFVCPVEYENDRIGGYFGGVHKAKVY